MPFVGGYGSLGKQFFGTAEELSGVKTAMYCILTVAAPFVMALALLNFAVGVVLEIYGRQRELFLASEARHDTANILVRCYLLL